MATSTISTSIGVPTSIQAVEDFYSSEAYMLTVEQYGSVPVGTVIVESNYRHTAPGHCPNCHNSAKHLTSWGFCARCTRRKHLK